jgi:methionyl-tRNA formyltransferase
MRIIYFANNRLGAETLDFLREVGDSPVGLVIHPPDRRKCGDRILEAANLPSDCVFAADRLKDPKTQSRMSELEPDLILSVLFGYLIPTQILKLPKVRSLNLHPSYLPYNRGTFPNVWSLVDGTPAGVTLHEMDKTLDTGAIVAQTQVDVRPTDTGRDLYVRLEKTGLELLRKSWPRIRSGDWSQSPQSGDEGSYHRTKDVDRIDKIDLDASYTGREIIDIIRARTFPPYDGAYFEVDGKRVYMRLELYESAEEETD